MKDMKKFKVLNLYACLGGNRYKWDEVAEEAGIDMKVTAVELDPELAKLYQERFPNDIVVVADAHQYLLDHYQEFDFIWTSPPCPTHSKSRYWGFGKNGKMPVYPDLKLYEEIIFLEYHFEGKYVVENVNPYYEPLIPAQKRDRHHYWCNFRLPQELSDRNDTALVQGSRIGDLSKFHDYDFKKYKGEQRVLKIARNLVDYKAGKAILETALGIIRKKDVTQTELF
jgi:DNA (cytosine-5)-methyltransferase 1